MCGILAKSLAVVVGDDEIVLGRVIVHVAVAKVGVLRVGAATAVPAGNDEDRSRVGRGRRRHSVGGVIFAVADLGKFLFCDIVGRLAAVHPLLGVAPGAVGLQVPHIDTGKALAVLVLVAVRVAEDLIHAVAIHIRGGHFEVGVILLQVA